jgi:hypothetical protein
MEARNSTQAEGETERPSAPGKVQTIPLPPIITEKKHCRFCHELISQQARVCPHCGRPQSAWKIHHLELTSLVSAVVALGLLVLGAFQYHEAKKDRIKADEAFRRATNAANSIENLVAKQTAESTKINTTFSELFSDVCDAFEGAFDSDSYSCVLSNGKVIKYHPATAPSSTERK